MPDGQDPFIYKGRLGYHVVCHDMERGDKSESDGCRFQGYEGCSGQVGLHAYAREILPDGCAAGRDLAAVPRDCPNASLDCRRLLPTLPSRPRP